MSTRMNSLAAVMAAALIVTPAIIGAQQGAGRGAGRGAGAGGGAAGGAAQGGQAVQGGQAAPAGRGGGRQAGPQLPPAGPTPRMANGKPDLSGHWNNPYTPDMARKGTVLDPTSKMPITFARMGDPLPDARPSATGGGMRTYDLPYTEWGLKQWVEYDPVNKGDYAGSCLPFGMSRNINSPHGVQMIQNPDALAMLFEQNTWFHWVPTNGMKWPADLPESWNGVSVGRWDGDTLVIETTGFNGYTRLDTSGHPHSKELKMTNTLTRIDSNTIQHTVTVHDPKTYTRDWMNTRTWRIKPYPDVIMEYSCEENNLENLFSGAIKPWKPPVDEN